MAIDQEKYTGLSNLKTAFMLYMIASFGMLVPLLNFFVWMLYPISIILATSGFGHLHKSTLKNPKLYSEAGDWIAIAIFLTILIVVLRFISTFISSHLSSGAFLNAAAMIIIIAGIYFAVYKFIVSMRDLASETGNNGFSNGSKLIALGLVITGFVAVFFLWASLPIRSGFGFLQSIYLLFPYASGILSGIGAYYCYDASSKSASSMAAAGGYKKAPVPKLTLVGVSVCIFLVFFVALFSLSACACPSQFSTTCLPGSGYLCSGVIFNHGVVGQWPAGNVLLTIGQTTGINWVTANIFYVPQGTALSGRGVPDSIYNSSYGPLQGDGNTIGYSSQYPAGTGLVSGQMMAISLGVPGSSYTVPVGVTASGTIWAQYTILNNPDTFYAQIGTIILKAS